jgi:adenine-specific DNA-methyltransferase
MEKITKDHPLSKSEDILQSNIETLKKIFPTIVKEGKIDMEELKALLSDDVEKGDEYYRFTWAGKSEARREANKPSTGTLRPDKESSKNWDSTQNIFIEGDNLEVLKLLQKSYAGKIKMIYIDPPYNTGKDFVYKDNYSDNLGNYLELTGQTDEEGKKISTNTESDGRYHSNWLNMMYPRLKLARTLLREDGVIFISIDDNEVHNIRKICDEIFGEENFISQIIWEKRYGRSNDQKFFSSVIDYIVLYRKSPELKGLKEPRNTESNEIYSNPDNDPRGVWTSVSFVSQRTKEERPNLAYEIQNPNTNEVYVHPVNAWKYSREKYEELLKENRFYWGKDGTQKQPRIKRFLSELGEGLVPVNLWKHSEVGTGEVGTKEVDSLLGKEVFSYPKPTTLLKKIIEIGALENDTVLDFFAGSGSLSEATMRLNAERNEKRKCISIQLPQNTDEKSEAYKAGYKYISEITKERIRRAGEKLKEELKSKIKEKESKTLELELENDNGKKVPLNEILASLDIGFKAFKLDTSNINTWDGNPDNLEQTLLNSNSNIKIDRTEDDVLYEVLLKFGLDLTVPIEERTISNSKVYSIGHGVLFVCLADNIYSQVAEGIGKWKEELNPVSCRVLFKDAGFPDDAAKTNSTQILKRYGINEINSL